MVYAKTGPDLTRVRYVVYNPIVKFCLTLIQSQIVKVLGPNFSSSKTTGKQDIIYKKYIPVLRNALHSGQISFNVKLVAFEFMVWPKVMHEVSDIMNPPQSLERIPFLLLSN